MIKLRLLEPQARHLLSDEFRTGKASVDLTKYVKEFERSVPLDAFCAVIDKARERFEHEPATSDGWLAPRVHATVRLTRREAADPRVWDYLAIVVAPQYVRWRWPELEVSRFAGPEYKQAIARLWWGAEMTRDGSDYRWTKVLFANQDFQNSWARLDLFHHRPAVLAAAKLFATMNGGKMATSDQIRQLRPGINMVLTTTILDSVAANHAPDIEVIRDWVGQEPDETKMIEQDPLGPPETPVSQGSIDAVSELLQHAVQVTTFFKRERSQKKNQDQSAIA